MNKSGRTEVERFSDELEKYRSIVGMNRHQLDQDPILGKQLSFWMESTRFLITELGIWDELGSEARYDETVNKVQNALNHVHQLIVQLIEKS